MKKFGFLFFLVSAAFANATPAKYTCTATLSSHSGTTLYNGTDFFWESTQTFDFVEPAKDGPYSGVYFTLPENKWANGRDMMGPNKSVISTSDPVPYPLKDHFIEFHTHTGENGHRTATLRGNIIFESKKSGVMALALADLTSKVIGITVNGTDTNYAPEPVNLSVSCTRN